ncbi:transglycosylase domain-containing protein [Streptomyces sp. NBC_01571]|uniref:transglycosylase domain-containing protein n=1 Tax=Streptomyces sp. NBC_01571 TaxID=2975883 RepID=UPI0022583CC7|nr:transglycosylase domain-containing protein [Streptomyces sp. NBC_01571]
MAEPEDDGRTGRREAAPKDAAGRRTGNETAAEETTQLRIPPRTGLPAEETTQFRIPPRADGPAEETTQFRIPPRADGPAEETTQFRIPPRADGPAEETTQLRIPPRAEVPDGTPDEEPAAAEEDTEQADRGASSRHRGSRRRPVQSSVLAGRLAPLARRLKPQYPRPGRTGWRRWVPSWRQWLAAWGLAIGLSTSLLAIAYAATDIPKNLNTYATQQDNVYFWSDGTPMARTGWVQRQAMPLKDIPEQVRWAVLAAENESFYSDPGISLKGISRALVRTVGQGDTQGGSTITQQYVKNVYLTQNQTVTRKFTEAMISLKLDNRMSKDKILEGYLNTSWFGRGTYGLQRASQAYYGKDVSRLNASEGAFLASLLKGAGLYDPTLSQKNHDRAVERWSWILDRMVKIGQLSPAERANYTKFPEPLKQGRVYDTGKQSDYLVELATQYAKKAGHISDKEFDLGGYQIYTTFDRKRETALTDAVTKARDKARKDDADTAKTAHYGAASVATDGRILAVYGGPDHRTQGYNESNATTVPAGSAFLPFVYAAGLQHGVHKTRDSTATPVSPESLYDADDGVPVSTPEGPYWDRSGKKVAAHNDGNKSWGRISLRKALAESVNVPFMQLGMDTGLDRVRQTAEASGLLSSSLGPQVPALSLGSSTPSAIRMANSYATFAADGSHTEPYSVRRVTRNGSSVALATPRPRRAVRPEVAGQVTEALTDAFRGAHPAAAQSAPQTAGKAGTTQDDKAAWYVGTNRSVSTAIVLYRLDLTKSLEPLPLKGIAGTPDDDVPYGIWAGAMSPLG